jgi:hypothetical protein
MANALSNHFKYMLGTKKIDFLADSFKIILMVSSFSFNKDTHATYADVSASELATGFGYTVNTKTLTGVVVTEDDTNDRLGVTWSSVSWTAAGGSIGPTIGAIIFDDTTVDDTVLGFVDCVSVQTAVDGVPLTIIGISFQNN